MNKFNKKIVLNIFLNILLFLLFLEAFLRIGGAVTLLIQKKQNEIKLSEKSEYRIICLGESLTFDGGDDSYPAQLEKILNASNLKMKFKIINKGIAGQSSVYILDNIAKWLDEYNPQMAVLMIGMNDYPIQAPIERKLGASKIYKFLSNIRIFKLGKGIWKNMLEHFNIKNSSASEKKQIQPPHPSTTKPKEDNRKLMILLSTALEFSAQGDFKRAEYLFKDFIQKGYEPTFTYRAYNELASLYKRQKKFSVFANTLKYFYNLNATDVFAVNETIGMCQNPDSSQYALQMLYELKEASPQSEPVYTTLSNCYEALGNKELAQYFSKEAGKLRDTTINPDLKERYLKIIGILEARNVVCIHSQFPLKSVESLKNMFVDLDNFHNMIFVDNEKIFLDALSGAKYEDYFKDKAGGTFGHGTKAGYYLLANNIADEILRYFNSR